MRPGIRLIRLTLVVGAVGILLSILGCPARRSSANPASTPVPSGPETIAWVRLDRERPGESPLQSVKPDDLLAHVSSVYRVIPDRRILYAAAEVSRLVSPKPDSTISVRFRNGEWSVALNGSPVGSLPEIPTYADGKRMLSGWARHVRAPKPKVSSPVALTGSLETDLQQGSFHQALGALAQLNALWKANPWHPELLKAATRGYVWLLTQTWDELQLSDPIAGKALALLVLAQYADPSVLRAEEALLGNLMGYEAAAIDVANQLPANDPVRLYVTGDVKGLQAASQQSRDRRSEYLSLLLSADSGDEVAWYRSLEATAWAKEVEPAVLRAAVRLDDFGSIREVSEALKTFVFLDATQKSPPGSARATATDRRAWPKDAIGDYLQRAESRLASPPESELPKLESEVRATAGRLGGPLLDPESIAAAYFAPFYSAVHETARTLFDRLGSTDAAARYLQSVGETAAGTAAELKQWMGNRVEMRRGAGDVLRIASETYGSRNIGVVPLARMVYSVSISVASGGNDPALLKPMSLFFERLDTRPSDLGEAAKSARSPLFNLPVAEKYTRALAVAAPLTGRSAAVDLAWWSRDAVALRRIAADALAPVRTRSRALRYLGRMKNADASFLRARYYDLMRLEPESIDPLRDLVEWLEKSNDLEGAREAVRHWLDLRGAKRDLVWATAIEIDARLLEKQGKLDAAWEAIQPAMGTGKSGALLRGVSILTAQRKLDDAVDLARQHLSRYPEGADGYTALARALWLLDEPAQAAEVIAKSRKINPTGWDDESPQVFVETFLSRPPEDAEKAFAALVRQGLPPFKLANFATALGTAGQHELAFRLLSGLPATGSDATAIKLWAYDELKQVKGEEEARTWLRTTFAAAPQSGVVLFQHQRHELLWEPFVGGGPLAKNDSEQLIRAAAVLHMGKKGEAQRESLVSYFESRPRTGFAVYGLYLLGKADRREVLAQIKDPTYVVNAAWALGLKAASEGRAAEASDWLQVSLYTGLNKVPPHAWSYEMLYRWHGTEKLLAGVDLLAGKP